MAKKKMIIPRIDIPIMEANGNMSMAWYLFLSYLLSKSGEGGGGSGSFSPDGVTITTNSGGEAQTVAVKNQNTASGAIGQLKMWDGSGAEYEAQREAQTLDNNTLCVVKNVSNGADFGSITEEADKGADWGSVTESPGPVTNMALHIGDYVLGTEQDIY